MVMLDPAVRNAMLDRKLPLLGRLLAAGARSAVFEGGHLQMDWSLDDDDALWGCVEINVECEPWNEEQIRNTLYVSERLFHVAIRRCQEHAQATSENDRARQVGGDAGPPPGLAQPKAAPTDVSETKGPPFGPSRAKTTAVNAGFSEAEMRRIDGARGAVGRSNWARDIVLAAVLAGREPPAAPGAGNNPKYINFRLDAPAFAALEAARGRSARLAFMRAAILAAC